MKKIAVTGGSGMIGSRLIEKLLQEKYQVRVLQHHRNIRSKNIEVVVGDVSNENDLEKLILGCDALIHLAAVIDLNNSQENFEKINVDSVEKILNITKGKKVKTILTSSIVIFEDCKQCERDEKWNLRKDWHSNLYIKTKVEAEQLVKKSNSKVITIYPTITVDFAEMKDQAKRPSGISGWIWENIGGGIPGGIMASLGSKDRYLNFVDLNDLTEGIIKALEKGREGESYILGGNNLTADDYLKKIGNYLGKKSSMIRLPWWPFEVVRKLPKFIPIPKTLRAMSCAVIDDMRFSSTKAERELGYRPKWNFDRM